MYAYYEMIVFGCLNQITEWYKEIVAQLADIFQSNRLLHLESTFVPPVSLLFHPVLIHIVFHRFRLVN